MVFIKDPSLYLGKFNVDPTSDLVNRSKGIWDRMREDRVVVVCPSTKSALFMGWLWLYLRGYNLPYVDLSLGHYLDSILSHDDYEQESKSKMRDKNLIIVVGSDLYKTDFASQYLPSLLDNRLNDVTLRTLVIVVKGQEWVIPKGQEVINLTKVVKSDIKGGVEW